MNQRLANGRHGEQQALDFLLGRGLQLLERNFRSRYGEIDLVMCEADCLVFVEVRYRRRRDFGGAAASVDRNKQARLVSTALYYLQRHPGLAQHATRFDVVALSELGDTTTIDWICDAFQAD